MSKTRDKFFMIAFILVAVHALFTLISFIANLVGGVGDGLNIVFSVLTGFLLPIAADALLIIGLLLKKKMMIPLSFAIYAVNVLFSLFNYLINAIRYDYFGAWVVNSLFSYLGNIAFYGAIVLLIMGLFKLIEEPDETHPFAKKTELKLPSGNQPFQQNGQPPYTPPQYVPQQYAPQPQQQQQPQQPTYTPPQPPQYPY